MLCFVNRTELTTNVSKFNPVMIYILITPLLFLPYVQLLFLLLQLLKYVIHQIIILLNIFSLQISLNCTKWGIEYLHNNFTKCSYNLYSAIFSINKNNTGNQEANIAKKRRARRAWQSSHVYQNKTVLKIAWWSKFNPQLI